MPSLLGVIVILAVGWPVGVPVSRLTGALCGELAWSGDSLIC